MSSNASPQRREDVIDYLLEHPDLLLENPNLLSAMNIPHSTGVATSLVERQVSVLREQLRHHKHQLNELIQIATENGQLSAQLHILAEKLIATTTISDLIKTIKTSLIKDFSADKVELRILADLATPESSSEEFKQAEFVGNDWQGKIHFESFFSTKQAICGRLDAEQHALIFADQLPEYASTAVLPLLAKQWRGLMIIGSQNPEQYQADMGTEMLTQLGDLATLAIDPYLK